jgi:hypothetical protein
MLLERRAAVKVDVFEVVVQETGAGFVGVPAVFDDESGDSKEVAEVWDGRALITWCPFADLGGVSFSRNHHRVGQSRGIDGPPLVAVERCVVSAPSVECGWCAAWWAAGWDAASSLCSRLVHHGHWPLLSFALSGFGTLGDSGSLHAGGHAELAQDVADVHAGRLAADEQGGTDFRVGLALGE